MSGPDDGYAGIENWHLKRVWQRQMPASLEPRSIRWRNMPNLNEEIKKWMELEEDLLIVEGL